MNGRTTFTLLLIVLLLGAYVISTDQRDARMERRLRSARQAFNLDPRDVTSVRIDAPDGLFVLHRSNDVWRLVEPVDALADANAVLRFLESVSELRWTQMITKEQQKEYGLTLDHYGLENPRITISVERDALPFALTIGRDAPGGTEIYVKRDNIGSVFSVSRDFMKNLPTDANDLRDKRLIALSPDAIRRVEWTLPEASFQLSRNKDEQWQLDKPPGTRANGPAIRIWLNRMYEFSVHEFVADTMAAGALYGVDDPRQWVTFSGATAGDAHAIKIGNPVEAEPGLHYAAIPDRNEIVMVTSEVVDWLNVKKDQFRDYKLINLDETEVSGVNMVHGDQQLELVINTQGLWEVIAPQQFAADQEKVRDLVSSWLGASVLNFIDPPLPDLANYGLNITNRLIRFKRLPSATKDTVENDLAIVLGDAPDTNLLYGMHPDGNSIMELPSVLASKLITDSIYFRDTLVLSLPATNIMRVTQKIGIYEMAVELENQLFHPVQPNFVADTDALAGVLELVENLRADTFVNVNAPSLPDYGLEPPHSELILGLASTGLNRVLVIGREHESGGRYATVRGSDVIFVLHRDTIATLMKPVANPLTPAAANQSLPEVW